MVNGLTTTLTKANKTSNSLRTTVPASIIKILRLEEGRKLNWDFKVDEDKNIVVLVKPGE